MNVSPLRQLVVPYTDKEKQKRPKQFKKYLGVGVNKVEFVRFLLKDVVNVESKCYRLEVSENGVTSRPEDVLNSDQEVAETKMFLCFQHASQQFPVHDVCISTVDSDVLVLAVYCEGRIHCNLFVEIGSKGKRRITSVSKMATNIGKGISDALPALHAVSGCDARSAFYGLEKKKIYKIVITNRQCTRPTWTWLI